MTEYSEYEKGCMIRQSDRAVGLAAKLAEKSKHYKLRVESLSELCMLFKVRPDVVDEYFHATIDRWNTHTGWMEISLYLKSMTLDTLRERLTSNTMDDTVALADDFEPNTDPGWVETPEMRPASKS